MTPGALVAGLLLSVAIVVATPVPASRRLSRVPLRASVSTGSVHGFSGRSVPAGRPASACAVAGLAVALLVGGWLGPVAGALVAVVGPRLVGRLETAANRSRRLQRATDLPVAVDLLAACLVAGGSPDQALDAVREAVGGPVGEVFGSVAAALSVGAEPRAAWGPWLGDPAFSGLARAVVRAELAGAPLAGALTRAAVDLRAARRLAAEGSARRVGVLAVAPLGLCFLPAFILLGVVPVVAGLASTAFGTGP